MLLAFGAIASQLLAQEPFYLNRLRDGVVAYERGDFAESARNLEVACFGLLDHPKTLAEALVRLALAQEAMDDAAGYRRTFDRLVEIEDRFKAYSETGPEGKLKADFELTLARFLPVEVVESTPAFAPVVIAQREAAEAARLAGMTERQKIAHLESRIAADPFASDDRLELAEIHYRGKRYSAAAEQAAAVLETEAGQSRARCLLAASVANDGKRCEWALQELSGCGAFQEDPGAARGGLRCMTELEQWREAESLVASFTPEIRADRAISKLMRTVERKVARLDRQEREAATQTAIAMAEEGEAQKAPSEQEAVAVLQDAPPEPSRSSAPTEDPPPRERLPAKPPPTPPSVSAYSQLLGRLPSPDARNLQEAYETLLSSREVAAVDAALSKARSVADRHPGDRDAQLLNGELAYRVRRWATALQYFRRAGSVDTWESRPDLIFYFAVAAYEAGYREAAAILLRRCIEQLEPSELVRSYQSRILGR